MNNAYQVLGLGDGASSEQASEAYRRLAKNLHPDVNKRATAVEEFKKLQWAYDTLKDVEKKDIHDRALAKREVANVPDDFIDDVLDGYVDRPKKKKKKKKKKVEADAGPARMPDPQPYIPQYQQPPLPPPQDYGRGQAAFEPIPDGYNRDDTCGGIF